MREYKLIIGGIGFLVATVVAVGFTIIGSPVNQQPIRYDEIRYNDFQQLKYQIEQYYQSNGTTPDSLSQINIRNQNTTDPQTNKPYEYKKVTLDSYQLCTEFSTTPAEFKKNSSGFYGDIPTTHTQGYSCIELTIPEYIKKPTVPAPIR